MTDLHWQYNGADKWNIILEWCREEIPGQWATDRYETIYFATKEAYLYFMLRWA
jgi:hypothetical protein